MPFAATQMNQKTVILSEVSQTQKDKYHVIAYIRSQRENDTNELIYKTETDSQT